MKRFRLLGIPVSAAIAAIVVLFCASSDSQTSPQFSLGYYTEYNGINYSYTSITSFTSYLSAVSIDVFSVDAQGGITGSVNNEHVMDFDKENNIQAYACVKNFANGAFQPSLAHGAITNERTLIGNLLALVQSLGFDGLNIDFEGLDPQDREAYSQFVHDLAASLRPGGFKLLLSVPAEQADDPTNVWSGAFDYSAIGKDADLLQLMTYDEHEPGASEPGPVAGSAWVERSIQYAVSVVAASKLLIGLPAYGYDWKQLPDGTWAAGNSNPFGSFTWNNNPTQPASWDEASNSPYVDYTDATGLKHEAWFENSDSIQIKAALVKKYRLAGLSMWSLGDENLSFWRAAASGLQ